MQIVDDVHGFFWTSMSVNNCNTYLVNGPAPVLIDPGHLRLFDHVRRGLAEIGLAPEDLGLVLCTHAHPDHIESLPLFKKAGVPVAFHQEEWQSILAAERHLAAMGVELAAVAPDFFLGEGGLSVKGRAFQVYHTPGHSPGSVCLLLPESRALFTGDLVFKEGLGRTDLPGGRPELLKASILRMAELGAEWVLPGHGDLLQGAAAVTRNFALLQQSFFAYL